MQQPCEVTRNQHIERMAGNNEFLITDIVGEKAFNDLMKLQGELKATTTLYAAFATEIANASKSNPKTFEELTAKANGFATTLGKLNDASGEMTRIQQQQLTVLKQVSVQLNNTGGMNKLTTLMEQFTKNVQAASEALGRLSANASASTESQQQAAQGAQQAAQAMTQATQSLGNAEVNYDRLTKTIIEYNSEVEKLAATNARHKVEMDSVSSSMKLVERDFKTGKMSVDDYTKRIGELKLQYEQLKAATQQNSALIRNHATAIVSTSGSYYEMNAAMLELQKRYKALGDADRNSTLGQNLVKQANDLNTKLKEIDAQFGNYQRNVGNYSSAWNGLGMSIQQIGRELPSLAMGWNTFFLAISNNLPMLTDELARAKKEYKELTAQGQKATPVWKQVLGSVLSWQTAMVVGITVLSMYGKEIMEWVGSLFKSNKEADSAAKIQKELNDVRAKGAKDAQGELTRLELLYKATQDNTRSMDERKKAVEELQKQYPSYFGNMSEEEMLAGKAADSYAKLSQSIIASAQARAAEERMTEQSGIILDNQVKIADATSRLKKAQDELNSANESYRKNLEKLTPQEAQYMAFVAASAQGNVKKIEDEIKSAKRLIDEAEKVRNALMENINIGDLLSDKGGGAGAAGQEADDYASYIRKVLEDLNKSRIDLMKEGRAKEIAQINADHAARMAEITGNTQEETELRKNLEELKERAILEVNEKYDSQLREIEQTNLQNRLSAISKNSQEELDERLRIQLELNGLMRDAEIREAEQSGADTAAIAAKYEKEKNDIVMRNLRERIGLIEDGTDAEIRRMETDALKEKDVLEQKYRDGEISQREYEESLYKIGVKYSKMRLVTMIAEAREQLKLANLTDAQREELEQRIAQLQSKLDSVDAGGGGFSAKGIDDFNEALRNMQGVAQDSLGDTADLFLPIIDVMSGIGEAAKRMGKDINDISFEDFWNNLDPTQRASLILQGFASIASGLASVMSSIYDGRIEKLEEEQEANEEAYDAEVERIENLQETGAISTEEAEARKRAAEDRTRQKEEEIAKKKAELEQKQAKWNKANSIIQTTIATSLAIMQAYAQAGPIVGSVFAAIIAAMGAAQIAIIAAQQIPKYAKGTKDHPGGLAIVGDGGRREGVVTDKGVYATPDKPTLVDLPRHAQVIPDLKDITRMDGMKSDYGLLEKQLRDKRESGVTVNVDNDIEPLERRMEANTRQLRDIGKMLKKKWRNDDFKRIYGRI